jgi:3-oxoadipate enol-lactonase
MPSIRTSDGIEIDYELRGDPSKPVLMFSNSLGTTRSMWDKQSEAFSEKFHILRYDTRGHGQSGAPNAPYSLERLGEDVVELLDTLNFQSVHFCGLSLGGMTGMWLGIHAADRVRSLVLCCTSSYLPPPAMWDARIQQILDQGMASISNVVLSRWFTPSFLEDVSPASDAVRGELLSTSTAGYVGCCAAIRDMDLRPELAKIKKSCLVIAGQDDQATPPEHGKFIAAGIAGSRYLEIENAAHLSNIEQEESFNSAVSKFLAHEA